METDNEIALRIASETNDNCQLVRVHDHWLVEYTRRLRAEWQKQVEPDILDSLDWNRLISGERRALKPEHQGWFDKLYASPPTAPEMVSVPREPTEAMIDEGLRQGELYKNAQPLFFSPHVGVAIIYRAMLDV